VDIDPNSPFIKELNARSKFQNVKRFSFGFLKNVRFFIARFLNFREFLYLLRMLSLKEKNILLGTLAFGIIASLIFFHKLNSLFLIQVPSDGGAITEGIVGTPRFINPILAISDADRDLTSLIYSGLMRPDGQGGLEPGLAESYSVSKDGLSYTFTLKEKLLWSDKEKITSDDIIFTLNQATDPSLKSPRRASWEGVSIEKIDDKNIRFTLKKPYAPFLENTILGILPKHLWENASAEQMTFSDFNILPKGSGPYKIKSVKKNSSGIVSSYVLERNPYFVKGLAHIKIINLKFYSSEEAMILAFRAGEIDSMSGVTPETLEKIPLEKKTVRDLNLPRVFGIFFNQNENPILADKAVRKALGVLLDKKQIIESVVKGYATPLDSPIPVGTFGGEITEPAENLSGTEAIAQASSILSATGWSYNEKEKIWEKKKGKEKERLALSIETSDVPELKKTAEIIKQKWSEFGAEVNLKIFETGDLNQNVIRTRNYHALLFGLVTGRDPDPFAFWHSSQKNDPGLNIASYANSTVDKILETARVTGDSEKRKTLYKEFTKEILKDTPAIFLYSPKFIYIQPSELKTEKSVLSIITPSERFSQVHKWYTNTESVWRSFAKK